MKMYSIVLVVIGLVLIGSSFVAPSNSQQSSGTTNNITVNVSSTGIITATYDIPYQIMVYGYPFYFHGVFMNLNSLEVNGLSVSTITTTHVSGDVVSVILTGHTTDTKGTINIVFSFTAQYVINYEGFTSTNYVQQYSQNGIFDYQLGNNNLQLDLEYSGIIFIVAGAILYGWRRI